MDGDGIRAVLAADVVVDIGVGPSTEMLKLRTPASITSRRTASVRRMPLVLRCIRDIPQSRANRNSSMASWRISGSPPVKLSLCMCSAASWAITSFHSSVESSSRVVSRQQLQLMHRRLQFSVRNNSATSGRTAKFGLKCSFTANPPKNRASRSVSVTVTEPSLPR